MKRGTFPASLYGRTVAALGLPVGIPALRAILFDSEHIRCGDMFVVDEWPVWALCRRLRDAGVPDSALAITWADRSPAMFVQSFYASAWSPERLASVVVKARR
jgi:hypothetical protein